MTFTQEQREEWAGQLDEAQELLDQVIQIVKRYASESDNDYFRRTVVAHLEMAFSDQHSWVGGLGHTLADEIEALWS